MTPPNDILGAIARRKRWERDHLRSGLRGSFRVDPGSDFVPGAEVLERAKTYLRQGGCERERRPWAPALSRPERLSVVAELKRRSPSAGELATWTDPEPLAQAFEEAGAAALSVFVLSNLGGGDPPSPGKRLAGPTGQAEAPGPTQKLAQNPAQEHVRSQAGGHGSAPGSLQTEPRSKRLQYLRFPPQTPQAYNNNNCIF